MSDKHIKIAPRGHIKVLPNEPVKFSFEDLLRQPEKALPYVENEEQPLGKLINIFIEQVINLLKRSKKKADIEYASILDDYFNNDLSLNEIATKYGKTFERIRQIVMNLFDNKQKKEKIYIAKWFEQRIIESTKDYVFKPIDDYLDDNKIGTDAQETFLCNVANLDILSMPEWGDIPIFIPKETIGLYRKQLISLKSAICEAIVPTDLDKIINNAKTEFEKRKTNKSFAFDCYFCKVFLNNHPWIEKDEDENYSIATNYLVTDYQRQGRIIYEAGDLIHYNQVKTLYESLYNETYSTPGISNTLKKREEHDFFPYGKTGQWYYSEDGSEKTIPNKALSQFVDKKIIFYWDDLSEVIAKLKKTDSKLKDKSIRDSITSLCYIDANDKNHFVKKGEEQNYTDFNWSKNKQSRVNWLVNHVFEIINASTNHEIAWPILEKQLKQDIAESNRPKKVFETFKYHYLGDENSGRLFIFNSNNVVRVNEDVLQEEYNGDLSLVGVYRKHPDYYVSLQSLAMTLLRKQENNEIRLSDFVHYALENIENDGSIGKGYIRKFFENEDNLPKGLRRYNQNGTVYIKLELEKADEEAKQDIQTSIPEISAETLETTKLFIEDNSKKEPVTASMLFNWNQIYDALKEDLDSYNYKIIDGITSDLSLNHFIKFMKESENRYLNRIFPQCIYEFHFARIDRYNLYQYLLNLTIGFEALLTEIYQRSNHHIPLTGKGIYDICEIGFVEYASAIKSKDNSPLGKIIKDLTYKRNKMCHGSNLQLPILTLVHNILDYTALYIYTVNKYWKVS